ncbi:MAG: VWA domain-containing protein, partial [Thermoanaerobaculia bacterium]
MFIDNYSLEPFRRDKVLQSLRKFVDEQLRAQDQVMLVLCTQQLKVITPFTSDKKVIDAGIASVARIAGAGLNRTSQIEQIKTRITEFIDSHRDNVAEAASGKPGGGQRPVFFEWKDFFSKSLSIADQFVEEEILSSRNTLTALGQVAAMLAGVEGKNVIIFAGAHLPEHPGAELYLWLYNAFSPYMSNLSVTTEAVSGKTGSMQHYSIEDAAKQASANNVALYIIDAADTRDTASAEHAMPVDKAEQFASFTNTAMAYQTLARISGGLALTNSDNFDSAFQSLAADLNAYYALGFKPANTGSNEMGRIVVTMKNPEY